MGEMTKKLWSVLLYESLSESTGKVGLAAGDVKRPCATGATAICCWSAGRDKRSEECG
jgi:hypothetical protein